MGTKTVLTAGAKGLKKKCPKEDDSQIRTCADQERTGCIFWSTCLQFSLMLKRNMGAPQHPDVKRNPVSAAS